MNAAEQTGWQRPDVEAPLIVWEYVAAVERIADERVADRDALQERAEKAEAALREIAEMGDSLSGDGWYADRAHAALGESAGESK